VLSFAVPLVVGLLVADLLVADLLVAVLLVAVLLVAVLLDDGLSTIGAICTSNSVLPAPCRPFARKH
jgi:hypothetical protein